MSGCPTIWKIIKRAASSNHRQATTIMQCEKELFKPHLHFFKLETKMSYETCDFNTSEDSTTWKDAWESSRCWGCLCDNCTLSLLPLLVLDWRTFSKRVAGRWWRQSAKNQCRPIRTREIGGVSLSDVLYELVGVKTKVKTAFLLWHFHGDTNTTFQLKLVKLHRETFVSRHSNFPSERKISTNFMTWNLYLKYHKV